MKTPASEQLLPSTRILWLTVLLVAVLYAWGMDNLYMPSNGDEMVYNHIARLTAASGQWLPLVSDLNDMRNTKPPLLFWQSMVITGWGQDWQLWLLRLPASLPFLFPALRVGIAAGLVGAMVAELPTGAQAGLGARLLTGSYYGNTVQIWSALVMSALLGLLLTSVVAGLEHMALRQRRQA